MVAGCNSATTSSKGIIGTYGVMISAMGKSDPDIMSIAVGAGNTILFTFTAGITTDLMGPNPDGLRATLDGMKVAIPSQPAHVDHSTGQLDGMMSGDGTIAPDGSMVSLTLHFQPTNFVVRDADGGVVDTGDGGAPTLDYTVDGAKQ
jgi:hypothetical protein